MVVSINRFVKRLDLAHYAKPLPRKHEPIHDWFVFPHSFSKQLVEQLLASMEIAVGSKVADIFAGAGTTLLTCKQHGVSCIGYDLLPVAVHISNTKVADYRVEGLRRALEFLISNWDSGRQPLLSSPQIPIIRKAFDEQTLRQFLLIREDIAKLDDAQARDFFLTALLGIIGYFSKTLKAGGWLKLQPDKEVLPSAVFPGFCARAEQMMTDLTENKFHRPLKGEWKTYLGDARALEESDIYDGVITSPPYLNKHDYTRIFALELGLVFVSNHEELKALRYNSLCSHTEARRQDWINVEGYIEPPTLTRLISQMSERELYNPKLPSMVRGYFEDMYCVLRSTSRILKRGAKAAFVLGNVRYAGIMIPVDEIVAEIGEQVGMKWVNTWIIRYRGNSAQQMGKYTLEPSRESIVFWKQKK